VKERIGLVAIIAGVALLVLITVGFQLAVYVFVAYLISRVTGIPILWVFAGGAIIVLKPSFAKLFRRRAPRGRE
jgi:hypothetical protein